MKITKFEHACLCVELLDQQLIIDPGMFTQTMPTDVKEVVAVVYTHIHDDHLDMQLLNTLLKAHPHLTIFAPSDVLEKLSDVAAKKVLAEPGVSHTAGSFALDFYGHDHAVVYGSVPCENVGVMVNKTLFYPGDSFTNPKTAVPLLALPAGAPWMKVSEAIDYLKEVMPQAVFPTHNAVLSDAGNMFTNSWLEAQATTFGVAWQYLQTGDAITVG